MDIWTLLTHFVREFAEGKPCSGNVSGDRYTSQFGEHTQDLDLKANVKHFLAGRLRFVAIQASPSDDRQGIIAHSEPRLRQTAHVEIVRRRAAPSSMA